MKRLQDSFMDFEFKLGHLSQVKWRLQLTGLVLSYKFITLLNVIEDRNCMKDLCSSDMTIII